MRVGKSMRAGWNEMRAKRNSMVNDMREVMYFHTHMMRNGKNEPNWRGVRVVKTPQDMILYAEAMWENHPDWIIETGTAYGGSALFLADMLELTGGKGKVITIDIVSVTTDRYGHGAMWEIARPLHPRIEYVTASSIDPETVQLVRSKVSGNVMVVLDSNHKTRHVQRELMAYADIVTPGQYMVVEDCYSTSSVEMHGPGHAVAWFLTQTNKYILDPTENKYLIGITRGGWLKRIT